MAKKKRIPVATGPRNPMHNHPLLLKSGVHQQTAKAKRALDKVNLKKEWSQVSAITFTCDHFFYLQLSMPTTGNILAGAMLAA